jgi:hypothetical protein
MAVSTSAIQLPDQFQPVIMSDGRADPIWYEALQELAKRVNELSEEVATQHP